MTDSTLTPLPSALEVTASGMSWADLRRAYGEELRQRSGSEETVRQYLGYVDRFLERIGDPAAATPALVHAFAYALTRQGTTPRPATVMVRLAALDGFYDLARRIRLIDRNPADDVKRPRNSDPRPHGLSTEEIHRLIRATPPTPAGARDRAAILTAVLTGLRRSELLGLTKGSLEHRAGRVYYRARTKGGHERYRELPAPAFHAIRQALEELGTPYDDLMPEDRLFPIEASSFYRNLQRYAAKADLEDVTPHVLRHSAAKLRRQTGASLEDVGTFLGHRSLHTTSRYLAALEGETDPGWYGVAAALGMDMQEVSNGE